MRVPLSWLKDFVAVPEDPQVVAKTLTELGLEVEEVLFLGSGLHGVAVAEVLELHRLGERLVRALVAGPQGEATVVTGAPNVRPGQKVAWAAPGATLPDGRTVGVATFLGVRSEGMLLSPEEAGLGREQEGILVLPEDAPVGADLRAYLSLPEPVLDLALTPSFASFAQSVLGVARELAAALDVRLQEKDVRPVPTAEPLAFVAPDPRLCSQYFGLAAHVPPTAASPFWLRRRLWSAGLRSHSLAVDLTNYLMWELGHPIHAFDLDRLHLPLTVRRAAPHEHLLLLDGREVELGPEDLVIADQHGPVALAGVMGGLETGVSASTARVLFEVALFDPAAVRRTGLRHGVASEAMARFEKGVDPSDHGRVLGRLAELLEAAGASVAGVALDFAQSPAAPRTLELRTATVRRLLGLELAPAACQDYLERLGCRVRAADDRLTVTVPSWRPDLTQEADLVEEVARLFGYQRLAERLPPAVQVGRASPALARARGVRHALADLGWAEALTYSWVTPQEAEGFAPADSWVRLRNPLREGEDVLRPSLLPRLLKATAGNLARQVVDVRLFEIGRVFAWEEGAVREEERVALAGTGALLAAGPTTPPAPLDVFALKGQWLTLARSLGVEEASVSPQGEPAAYLHPGRQARLAVGEEVVGVLGELHPEVAERFSLPRGVVVAEWRLEALAPRERTAMAPLPRFPSVRRDLSVTVPQELPYGALEEAIAGAGVAELRRWRLFDVYTGEAVGPGRKSFAVALWFRSDAGTLTEAAVDAAVAAVLRRIEALGGRLRDGRQGL